MGLGERRDRDGEREDERTVVPRTIELHGGVTSRRAPVDKGAVGVSKWTTT
jgi:hypothetical protein